MPTLDELMQGYGRATSVQPDDTQNDVALDELMNKYGRKTDAAKKESAAKVLQPLISNQQHQRDLDKSFKAAENTRQNPSFLEADKVITANNANTINGIPMKTNQQRQAQLDVSFDNAEQTKPQQSSIGGKSDNELVQAIKVWKYGEGQKLINEGMQLRVKNNDPAAGADQIEKGTKMMRDNAPAMEGAPEYKNLGKAVTDKEFYTKNLLSQLPMSAGLMAGQTAAGVAGGLAKLIPVAGTAAGLGINAAAAGWATKAEADMEMADTYQQVYAEQINKGVSPQNAHNFAVNAAKKARNANLALLGATNFAEQMTVFGKPLEYLTKAAKLEKLGAAAGKIKEIEQASKLGKIAVKTGNVAGKMAATGLQEAGEEGGQYAIQQWAQDKPIDMGSPEARESMAMGGIQGGLMAGAGGTFNTIVETTVNERNNTTDPKTAKAYSVDNMGQDLDDIKAATIVNLPGEVMPIVKARVDEQVSKGETPAKALDTVLDEIANTPIGGDAISKAAQEVEGNKSNSMTVYAKDGSPLKVISQPSPEFYVVQNTDSKRLIIPASEVLTENPAGGENQGQPIPQPVIQPQAEQGIENQEIQPSDEQIINPEETQGLQSELEVGNQQESVKPEPQTAFPQETTQEQNISPAQEVNQGSQSTVNQEPENIEQPMVEQNQEPPAEQLDQAKPAAGINVGDTVYSKRTGKPLVVQGYNDAGKLMVKNQQGNTVPIKIEDVDREEPANKPAEQAKSEPVKKGDTAYDKDGNALTITNPGNKNTMRVQDQEGNQQVVKKGEVKAEKPAKNTTAATTEKKPDTSGHVKSLRDQAARMQKSIDEKKNPAIGNQNPTARRANIAAGMYAEAERMEEIQGKLNALADAIESGNAPEVLHNIKKKTHIETIRNILNKARYRRTNGSRLSMDDPENINYAKFEGYVHPDHLKTLLTTTKGRPGTKDAALIVQRIANSGGRFSSESVLKAIEALNSKLSDSDTTKKYIKDSIADFKRILDMGVTNEGELRDLLQAYIELGSTKSAEKPAERKIKEMERELIGAKIPGYFPTPKTVVNQMVELAEIEPGMKVLEPSAGKGSIADVIRETEPKADIDVIEINPTLRNILKEKGYNVVGDDFMEFTGEYNVIVMNPPFEKGQDIDHVRHAYELLKPGGKIVAIMSEGPFFRSDKKATEFRDWLDEQDGTSEKLPEKSFTGKEADRQTGVAARMVVIEKPEAKAETKPEPTIITGKTVTAKTERGTSINAQYAVVDADDLVASHSTELKENKGYPQELQPRDRSRVASEAQITRILNNLEPEFLGASPKASEGSPIVGPDMVVESGNGRIIALKRGYERNHENIKKYRQWLLDNASNFGIDSVKLDEIKNPILVRVRKSDIDRINFVKEANEQSVAAMSASEQAKSDAEKLTPEMMAIFSPMDDGNVLNRGNHFFIREFMSKVVGTNEQGRYATSDGSMSQEGVSRIKNAIFAKAYGNSDTLEKLAESTDNNVKNITNAMLIAAPKMAAIKSGMETGEFYPLDITAEIAAATNKLSQLREQGTKVELYLIEENQDNMFGEHELDPLTKDILEVFDKHKGSAKAISSILIDYADGVVAAGNPNQGDLWGDTPAPAKADLLRSVLERMEEGNGNQTSLFADERLDGKETEKTDGGAGQSKTGREDQGVKFKAPKQEIGGKIVKKTPGDADWNWFDERFPAVYEKEPDLAVMGARKIIVDGITEYRPWVEEMTDDYGDNGGFSQRVQEVWHKSNGLAGIYRKELAEMQARFNRRGDDYEEDEYGRKRSNKVPGNAGENSRSGRMGNRETGSVSETAGKYKAVKLDGFIRLWLDGEGYFGYFDTQEEAARFAEKHKDTLPKYQRKENIDEETPDNIRILSANIDKDYAAYERSKSKQASVNAILENLDRYRREDLESLAEQYSNGSWDGYEELSDTELIDALRESLEGQKDEMTPLEAQSAKSGYYVRPPKDKAQFKAERSALNVHKNEFWRESNLPARPAEGINGTRLAEAEERWHLRFLSTVHGGIRQRFTSQSFKYHPEAIEDPCFDTAVKICEEMGARLIPYSYTKPSKIRFDGFITPDGNMYINVDGSYSPEAISWHEDGHWLKKANPEAYKELEDLVVKRLNDTHSDGMRRLVKYYEKHYPGSYKPDEILEEFISDMFPQAFSKEDAFFTAKELQDKLNGFIDEVLKGVEKANNAKSGSKTKGQEVAAKYAGQEYKPNLFAGIGITAKAKAQKQTEPMPPGPDTSAHIESKVEKGPLSERVQTMANKDYIERASGKLYGLMVDDLYRSGDFDEAAAKALGLENLPKAQQSYILALASRHAPGTAKYNLTKAMTDREFNEIGDPLESVLAKIPKGRSKEVNDYMILRNSISWMKQGKHVYSEEYGVADYVDNIAKLQAKYNRTDPEDTEKLAELQTQIDSNMESIMQELVEPRMTWYEENMPDVIEAADGIVDWLSKFTKSWLVDNNGMLSEKTWEAFKEAHPYYVPFNRILSEMGGMNKGSGVKRGYANQPNPVKGAKGSRNKKIVDPIESIIEQVFRYTNSARRNEVMQAVIHQLLWSPEELSEFATINYDNLAPAFQEKLASEGPEAVVDTLDEAFKPLPKFRSSKPNEVTGIWFGQKITVSINDPEFFKAMTALNPAGQNLVLDILRTCTRVMKSLTTGLSIFFSGRNLPRDLPTSYINSKSANPLTWGIAILDSIRVVATGGKRWDEEGYYKLYQAMGRGMYSSSGATDRNMLRETKQAIMPGYWEKENNNPITYTVKAANAALGGLEQVTSSIENIPRFAAFKRALESKEFADYSKKLEAGSAGSEATVNFTRRGSLGFVMDGIIPYFNAAIQGLDNFAKAFARNPKGTLAKGLISITVPTLLLYLLNHDDDDWKKLSRFTKDNYYCIPCGHGEDGRTKFIKIAKPREWGVVFSDFPERALRALEEQDMEAFKDFKQAFKTSFVPAYRPIFAPLYDVAANSDFAGRPIEPGYMTMADWPDKLRYDETTSSFAIGLGDAFDLSPKKIDYLLKSYSGIIGQLVLPAFSEGRGQGVTSRSLEGAKRSFVGDPLYSNDILNDFYDQRDLLVQAEQERKLTGKKNENYNDSQRIMFNRVAGQIGDISKQIRSINANKAISFERKQKMVEKLQAQKMELAQKQLDRYKKIKH